MSHTVPVNIMCGTYNPDTHALDTETVTAQVDTDSFADAYAVYLREINEGVVHKRYARRDLIEAALADSIIYDNNRGAKRLIGVVDDVFDIVDAMRSWLAPEQLEMLDTRPSRAKPVFA